MPSQLVTNEHIGFLCARNFIYGPDHYSVGDEFPGEKANNIETLVRARYVIPVVDELSQKPRHWHLGVRLRSEIEQRLSDGAPVQIMFETPPDSDETVDIPTLTDPNREPDAEGEPNPLPGPPEGWDNENREPVEEDVVAPPPEESDEPEPEPEPASDEAVPEGTIPVVQEWVGDDPDRAQAALEAEEAGQNRSTLIAWLEDRLG